MILVLLYWGYLILNNWLFGREFTTPEESFYLALSAGILSMVCVVSILLIVERKYRRSMEAGQFKELDTKDALKMSAALTGSITAVALSVWKILDLPFQLTQVIFAGLSLGIITSLVLFPIISIIYRKKYPG